MSSRIHTGFFITFEGSEGCGKSTQTRLLLEELRARGYEPIVVREPGGTSIGEELRHLIQHAPDSQVIYPETELLLFAASRAQLTREVILPALAEGQIVISDRYLDSTTVYQGVARAIDPAMVAQINGFAVGQRRPDLTFLLDMDAATALERARSRSAAKVDRMEQEPISFYEAVREGYLQIARQEPDRFRIINAAVPQNQIAHAILVELETYGLFQRVRS